MHKLVCFLVVPVFATAGCGQKDPPISGDSKTAATRDSRTPVLAVGGELITSEEIIKSVMNNRITASLLAETAKAGDSESFKKTVRPSLEKFVEDKISFTLLLQQLKKEKGERVEEILERELDRQVRRLVSDMGSYTKARQHLEEQGLDWDSYRDMQRRAILVAWQMPEARPITTDELTACYNEMKEESFVVEGKITIRLLDIRVDQLKTDDPNESRQRFARELADELVRQIRTGEDFAALAEQHVGVWYIAYGEPIKPESLVEPYDILAAEVERMQPEDIAGPIETARGEHIFIVKLQDKQASGYRPLAEVQTEVEQRIIYDRRRRAAQALDTRLQRQVGLIERGEFIDFCLAKVYQRSQQQIAGVSRY